MGQDDLFGGYLPRKTSKRYPPTTYSKKVSDKTKKSLTQLVCFQGLLRAGDGTRIRDIQLGKLALYQLSYSREVS